MTIKSLLNHYRWTGRSRVIFMIKANFSKPFLEIAIRSNLQSTIMEVKPSKVMELNKQIANELIPNSSRRTLKSLEKQYKTGSKILEDLTIKLTDGSKKLITGSCLKRLSLQPKQEQKIECQAIIRRARIQERIFNELLMIYSSGIINDPILKRVSWRITRTVPNFDMRSYNVFWVIDNEQDIILHKVKCMIADD